MGTDAPDKQRNSQIEQKCLKKKKGKIFQSQNNSDHSEFITKKIIISKKKNILSNQKNAKKTKRIIKKKTKKKKKLRKQNCSILKKRRISINRISHYCNNKRSNLRKTYPKLAPYVFMSAIEKQKYFQDLNKEYSNKIKVQNGKKQKVIKFKKMHQVLYFSKRQKSAAIAQAEILKQPSFKPPKKKSLKKSRNKKQKKKVIK